MSKLHFFTLILIYSYSLLGQESFILSGYVTDIETNEKLIGVNVLLPELNLGTTTNEYGFYSISIPQGGQELLISYLGFKNLIENINLFKDQTLNIKLFPEVELLEEVVVKDNIERLNLRSPQMSVNSLAINTIKKMPATLGEVDIIKSITLLPGVTNGGEGASGFNVRGGAADQNLILLDEAIIFNSSHLFGFSY
jgi:hypothetical protein